MTSAARDFATTQVDQILDLLERAVHGLHYISGELSEISHDNPKVGTYITDRLLRIADHFANRHEAGDASASLPWSVALTSIVNVRSDKSAQMDRIEEAILRFARAPHGDMSDYGTELADQWLLELRTRQSVQAAPLIPN